MMANSHFPSATNQRPRVMQIPKKEVMAKNLFLAVPLSATAPKKGANKAIIMAAEELALPR